MLSVTHLTVVVLAAMFLRLNRHEWFIALMFGVVIDADHLFALPRYVGDNGWAAVLRVSWDDSSGLPWKSWFHYPLAAVVVGHLSLGWRFALPLLFWSVHLSMDWLQPAIGGYNTAVESSILALSSAGIVYLSYTDWSARTGLAGLGVYASAQMGRSRAALRGANGLMARLSGRT